MKILDDNSLWRQRIRQMKVLMPYIESATLWMSLGLFCLGGIPLSFLLLTLTLLFFPMQERGLGQGEALMKLVLL